LLKWLDDSVLTEAACQNEAGRVQQMQQLQLLASALSASHTHTDSTVSFHETLQCAAVKKEHRAAHALLQLLNTL